MIPFSYCESILDTLSTPQAYSDHVNHCDEDCASFAQDFLVRLRLCLEEDVESLRLLSDVPAARAQHAVDLLDQAFLSQQTKTTHRIKTHRLLVKCAGAFKRSPSSLVLSGKSFQSMQAIGCGGFADVFRADFDGAKVAVKRLRVFLAMVESDRMISLQRFLHEALLWRGLDHPHVLPLLGIHEMLSPQDLCMVSPWVDQGNVCQVLDRWQNINLPRPVLIRRIFQWMHESASGLSYLHREGIVHGDLRGANMLIGSGNKLMLSDFGLAVFAESTSHAYGSMREGNIQWLAPELVDYSKDKPQRPTKATDVFSLSRAYVELCTAKSPYPGLSSPQASNEGAECRQEKEWVTTSSGTEWVTASSGTEWLTSSSEKESATNLPAVIDAVNVSGDQ
ncbi:hypothetical protein EIP91_005077 [Steccherinum ochraceum]|uniref:Protein kinase domain-containing protein n=1 Tax=Steccherinum ochraceum TaxID=92696 RepID=A0A4R0RAC2_9APHY|nr:hypothetical protein EIP91_005077 [Steccherinum ochraceum]